MEKDRWRWIISWIQFHLMLKKEEKPFLDFQEFETKAFQRELRADDDLAFYFNIGFVQIIFNRF